MDNIKIETKEIDIEKEDLNEYLYALYQADSLDRCMKYSNGAEEREKYRVKFVDASFSANKTLKEIFNKHMTPELNDQIFGQPSIDPFRQKIIFTLKPDFFTTEPETNTTQIH